MRCIYCNSLIEDNSNYCKYCGNDLSAVKNKIKYDNEKYERAFVGNAYDSFKNSTFNVAAFFLGPIYLLYRKMYLITFFYIIISLSFPLIPNILLGFLINSLYLEHVKSKVKSIKDANSTMSTDSILEICEKKGGVSFIGPILYFIFVVALIVFCYYIFAVTLDDFDSKHNDDYNNPINNELLYYVPNEFKGTGNYYYAIDDNHSCTINIVSKDVLNDNINNYSNNNDVTIENINNSRWYFMINNNSYKYISFRNNKTYIIDYKIHNDQDGFCYRSFNTFKNSLKFVDYSSVEA